MESETDAVFTLTGSDLDPDRVTALTGVQPSRTWRTGELITERAIVRYKNNGWTLRSNVSGDLNEEISDVLDLLQPAWSQFVALSSRSYAEIACVVYSYGGARPPIHFDRDIVRRAAELNAAIDVDLYVLPKRRKPRISAVP